MVPSLCRNLKGGEVFQGINEEEKSRKATTRRPDNLLAKEHKFDLDLRLVRIFSPPKSNYFATRSSARREKSRCVDDLV